MFNDEIVPHAPLTNHELHRLASKLGLRVKIMMRDKLRRMPDYHHFGIVNLVDSDNPGTHWVCYTLIGNTGLNEPQCPLNFDTFGQRPPQWLKSRLGMLAMSTGRIQKMELSNCGHPCLLMLCQLSWGATFKEALSIMTK